MKTDKNKRTITIDGYINKAMRVYLRRMENIGYTIILDLRGVR